MGYEFDDDELFYCDRCNALEPYWQMVSLENGEIYCRDCYEKLCAEAETESFNEEIEEMCRLTEQSWLKVFRNVPFYDETKYPNTLFLSQLPPKQKESFFREFNAGRDPFHNEDLMAKTQGLKIRNFNAVSFAAAEDAPSTIVGIGFVYVRDGKIVGRRREALGPENSFKKVWMKIMESHDSRPVPVPFVSYKVESDRELLKTTLKANGLEDADTPFIDILAHSKKWFKTRIADYQLKTVAASCNYDLREKHNLLNEAEATALIALKTIPISSLL